MAGFARTRARIGPRRTSRPKSFLLLERLKTRLRDAGIHVPRSVSTPYVNTIPAEEEPPYPGDREIERRIKSYHPLERDGDGREGQPRCTADSAATSPPTPRPRRCTKWRSTISSAAATAAAPADMVYFQGHASPGHLRPRVPRRRLDAQQLHNFRQELAEGGRAVVVSASVPDAGLLAVPDGLDGPRPDHVDLPGAVQPLPAGPRLHRPARSRRSGRSSATAKPTSPKRSARSRWPRAKSSTT